MATGLEHLYSNLDLLIDLLVDLSPEHSLLWVISLRQDLDALLGARLMSQKRYPMGATGPGAVAAGFSAGVQLHMLGFQDGADRIQGLRHQIVGVLILVHQHSLTRIGAARLGPTT
jgi:hypothetical protein